MNTRSFTLSLIIAGIAMFMVFTYIDGKENEFAQKYGALGPVVVASVEIKANELIDDRKITLMNIPAKFRAPGHVKDKKEIINTVASVPILRGEQITKPRVTYPGVKTGLSRFVTPGKRAISISIDQQTGVSRLIKPLDRVDVVAAIDWAGGRADKTVVTTVLQDILVLATDLNISNSIPLVGMKTAQEVKLLNLDTHTSYSHVTLELSPFQSQKIVWLRSNGARLTLVLRNNDDKNKTDIQETDLFDILTDKEREKARLHFQQMDARQNANQGQRLR